MRYLMAMFAAAVVAMSISQLATDTVHEVEVITYTVKSGDTLWAIANRYAPDCTKDVNEFMWQICQDDRNHNLFQAGRYLKPGDQILIPLIIKK